MEQWWAVVQMRGKWNGTVVGCGGTEEELEWNSGGLWWTWGGTEMEQWWAVVELGRDWNGAVVGRGGNEEEIEWNGGEPWWN